ncbi:MAG: phosphotransferase [Anaerolineae bacterium]|nr:phosphotransferase [Anaerolineae bacterium]
MDRGKIKVLVIDDDQIWQNRLQRMLVRWGYQVAVARSTKQAEAVLRQAGSFDLITVDMNLPQADGKGWGLVETFTKASHKPGLIIVGEVDFSPLEIRNLLHNYGHAVDFVSKSAFDPIRLKHIIDELLTQSVETAVGDKVDAIGTDHRTSLTGQVETALRFKTTPAQSNLFPNIRRVPGLTLTPAEEALLRRAFAGSREIFVEREFRSGYSGAVVLLVSPGPGQAQMVVKLATPADLHREFTAYQKFVKRASPQNTARLQGQPLLTDDEQLALLSYTFAGGDPRWPTHSLQAYYESKGGAAVAAVLDRIFRVYGRQWWAINRPQKFVISEHYDRLLPVHLKLKPTVIVEPHPRTLVAGQINASALHDFDLQPGQLIRLQGFHVAEIRPDRQQVKLTANPPPGEASAPLRLGLETDEVTTYRPGDHLETLDAVIIATRQSLLAEAADSACPAFDPETPHLNLNGRTYANPLLNLSDLLDRVVETRASTIHGDLNLQNILVDAETGFAWLIDFAETRRGPTLFDLQRLESLVITKLLPSAIIQAGLEPVAVADLLASLHADAPSPIAPHSALQESYTVLAALRRLARQYLMDDRDWEEYYLGLVITLLGNLKYTDLGVVGRQLALVGAATVRALMRKAIVVAPAALASHHAPLPSQYMALLNTLSTKSLVNPLPRVSLRYTLNLIGCVIIYILFCMLILGILSVLTVILMTEAAIVASALDESSSSQN